jgi:hypothetical protein
MGPSSTGQRRRLWRSAQKEIIGFPQPRGKDVPADRAFRKLQRFCELQHFARVRPPANRISLLPSREPPRTRDFCAATSVAARMPAKILSGVLRALPMVQMPVASTSAKSAACVDRDPIGHVRWRAYRVCPTRKCCRRNRPCNAILPASSRFLAAQRGSSSHVRPARRCRRWSRPFPAIRSA